MIEIDGQVANISEEAVEVPDQHVRFRRVRALERIPAYDYALMAARHLAAASPDSSVSAREIAEAYAVLSDPKKRADYDARGFAGVQGFSQEDLFSGINFDDIFGGLNFDFGGGGLFGLGFAGGGLLGLGLGPF